MFVERPQAVVRVGEIEPAQRRGRRDHGPEHRALERRNVVDLAVEAGAGDDVDRIELA